MLINKEIIIDREINAVIKSLMDDIHRLEAQKTTLREALGFYADARNYICWATNGTTNSEIDNDRGELAKQTLERIQP